VASIWSIAADTADAAMLSFAAAFAMLPMRKAVVKYSIAFRDIAIFTSDYQI
jgi:hypothetical protein